MFAHFKKKSILFNISYPIRHQGYYILIFIYRVLMQIRMKWIRPTNFLLHYEFHTLKFIKVEFI